MRSYYEHLEQTTVNPGKLPVHRSSAIFPVFRDKGINCRLIFLGYWLLKRQIESVTAEVTLRSEGGKEVSKKTLKITEPKAYRIELDHLLDSNDPFSGSLEVEFSTGANMVFPFPALAINYYGEAFSSVVHSAQRIYNDQNDENANSKTDVPESGFNIRVSDNWEPVIGIINGKETVENARFHYSFYQSEKSVLEHTTTLGTLRPYETRFLYPAREVDLKTLFQEDAGSAKLHFQIPGTFPRLMVGNLQKNPKAFVVTHSYYDCSGSQRKSDYWEKTIPEWYPANLMVPARFSKSGTTRLYLYPIYSPQEFHLDMELYDNRGQLISRHENVAALPLPDTDLREIDLKRLIEKSEQPIDLALRIMAVTKEGERLPARVKVAVDIGQDKKALPCNFCTNMQPYNLRSEGKKQTFRWTPLLADQKGAATWIMNSSPKKEWREKAEIKVTFYREQDTKTLERTIIIPPHGFVVIRPDEDSELKEFFQGKIGWMTAISDQPYVTTYYFVEHRSGVVGGDHGF